MVGGGGGGFGGDSRGEFLELAQGLYLFHDLAVDLVDLAVG